MIDHESFNVFFRAVCSDGAYIAFAFAIASAALRFLCSCFGGRDIKF